MKIIVIIIIVIIISILIIFTTMNTITSNIITPGLGSKGRGPKLFPERFASNCNCGLAMGFILGFMGSGFRKFRVSGLGFWGLGFWGLGFGV